MKNNKIRKLTFIGGDARALIAASKLRSDGFEVALYGFGDTDNASGGTVDSLCCSSCFAKPHEIIKNLADGTELDCGVVCASAEEAIVGADAVILPLPASSDGVRVSMPLASGTPLTIAGLVSLMAANGVKLLSAGKMPKGFVTLCESCGITVFDYYEREEFAIANAIPTAEGALEIAMRELPITVNGASALVIGYGRIGKALSRLLSAMGAHVTVSARKPYDLAWIRANGHDAAETGRLSAVLERRFDMIFNTVPHTVLGETELAKIPVGTLIVDLASKPGGVDIAAADRMSHRIIWALSLPGKVAPVTSGQIIADTVLAGIDGYFGGG